jgi:hypothetical protein
MIEHAFCGLLDHCWASEPVQPTEPIRAFDIFNIVQMSA